MIRRPPRSTRTDTLFPSRRSADLADEMADDRRADEAGAAGDQDFHGVPPIVTPGPGFTHPAPSMLNRPGFAGGCLVWVTPPWRAHWIAHSNAPRLLPEG